MNESSSRDNEMVKLVKVNQSRLVTATDNECYMLQEKITTLERNLTLAENKSRMFENAQQENQSQSPSIVELKVR